MIDDDKVSPFMPIVFTGNMPAGEREDRFERISPSSLSAIAACPRSYAIGRDLELAREIHPDIAADGKTYKLTFGSAFHKAVEDQMGYKTAGDAKKLLLLCEELTADSADYDYWDDYYQSPKDMVTALKHCLTAFYDSPYCHPWTAGRMASDIELLLEAELCGIKVKGIVDCIDGNGTVIDLKTTSAYSRVWHGTQLAMYRWLAKANDIKTQDVARVVKVIRPRQPNSNVSVSETMIDVAALDQHVSKLLTDASMLRDSRDEWKRDYTRIFANPAGGRCFICPARNTTACPETREVENGA